MLLLQNLQEQYKIERKKMEKRKMGKRKKGKVRKYRLWELMIYYHIIQENHQGGLHLEILLCQKKMLKKQRKLLGESLC